MQTRDEFLAGLIPPATIPDGVGSECTICTEELNRPVELCPQHIFCETCVLNWLKKKHKNTCPICRGELFALREDERMPVDPERVLIMVQALERSGLLTASFDTYGIEGYNVAQIQRAAAAAHNYLAEQHHEPITTGRAVISMRALGLHLIVMGNLLQAYASVTGRPYTRQQRTDWKIILNRIRIRLRSDDGGVVEDGIQYLANRWRVAVLDSLREGNLGAEAGWFVLRGNRESPAGDLNLLLWYLVFQAKGEYERWEAHSRAQRLALAMEQSRVGFAVRWVRQRLFGSV